MPEPVGVFPSGPGDDLSRGPARRHALELGVPRSERRYGRFAGGLVQPAGLALPAEVAQRSLTTLREKLVKIGAKVVRHGRSIVFQMAKVAVPRQMFQDILRLVARLRAPLAPV